MSDDLWSLFGGEESTHIATESTDTCLNLAENDGIASSEQVEKSTSPTQDNASTVEVTPLAGVKVDSKLSVKHSESNKSAANWQDLIPKSLDEDHWRSVVQKQIEEIRRFIADPSIHSDITLVNDTSSPESVDTSIEPEKKQSKGKYMHKDGISVMPLFQSKSITLDMGMESRGGQRGFIATRDIEPGEILLIEKTRWPLKSASECKAEESRPEMEFVSELLQEVGIQQAKRLLRDISPLYPQRWDQVQDSHRNFLESVYGKAVDAILGAADKSRVESLGLARDDILRLICVIHFDAFPKGICLHMAMVNHNCSPNAIKMAVNVKLSKTKPIEQVHELRASRKILAGEEVCISYIPVEHSDSANLMFRLSYLERQFQFTCTCKTCVEEANTLYTTSNPSEFLAEMKWNDEVQALARFYWRTASDGKEKDLEDEDEIKVSKTLDCTGTDAECSELFMRCVEGFKPANGRGSECFASMIPTSTIRLHELSMERRRANLAAQLESQFSALVAIEDEETRGKASNVQDILKCAFVLDKLSGLCQEATRILRKNITSLEEVADWFSNRKDSTGFDQLSTYPTVTSSSSAELLHALLMEVLERISIRVADISQSLNASKFMSERSLKILLTAISKFTYSNEKIEVVKHDLAHNPSRIIDAIQIALLDSSMYLLYRQCSSSRYGPETESGPSPSPMLLTALQRVQNPLQYVLAANRGKSFNSARFGNSIGSTSSSAARFDHAILRVVKQIVNRFNTGSPLIPA